MLHPQPLLQLHADTTEVIAERGWVGSPFPRGRPVSEAKSVREQEQQSGSWVALCPPPPPWLPPQESNCVSES